MMTPIRPLPVCVVYCRSHTKHAECFSPLRCTVNPSICIASWVAIFYSIRPDNQRLHDTVLLELMGLQRWAVDRESLTLHRPYLLLPEREKRQRELTPRKTRQRKKKSLMEGEGEGGVGAPKNRERRALQNSTAKTEVNCDENGRSHDHNSGWVTALKQHGWAYPDHSGPWLGKSQCPGDLSFLGLEDHRAPTVPSFGPETALTLPYQCRPGYSTTEQGG